MIPDSFIEELKYASDIERTVGGYVTLKRRGRNLLGLCPFHSEKSPSFTVYPESQSYYCFGCGNGGDVITFIRHVENLEYIEALKFLAQKAGMSVPDDAENDGAAKLKTRVLEINRESARFFHSCLMEDAGKAARTYLLERGLTPKTIKRFGLGYSPDSWNALRDHLKAKGYSYGDMADACVAQKGRNDSYYDLFRGRVMFPIIDLRGNVIGFGGRIMGDAKGPKYLNSPDTPVFRKSRNLFALNFAKAVKADCVILGEGYMDVIAMHQAGFENSVATLGTSLTSEQSRLISQYYKKAVIAYDSDSAGQSAAKRAINLFSQTDVSVSVLEMQGAKDPDEYIKKFGAARFENLVSGGKSAMQFEIDKLKAGYDLTVSEDKLAFLNEFCRLMADVQDDLLRDVYIGEVTRSLEVDKSRVVSTVEGIRKRKFYAAKKKNAHNLAVYAQDKSGTGENPRRSGALGPVIAQEKLITLLMKHPDYYSGVEHNIMPEDFSDDGLRQIFIVMSKRLQDGLPLDLIHFSGALPPNLMAKLSQLLVAGRELKFYREQADEYIIAIKKHRSQKSPAEVAEMSAEEYQAYITSLRTNKK